MCMIKQSDWSVRVTRVSQMAGWLTLLRTWVVIICIGSIHSRRSGVITVRVGVDMVYLTKRWMPPPTFAAGGDADFHVGDPRPVRVVVGIV